MRKLMMLICLLGMCSGAYASEVVTDGLTETQKAQIQLEVATLKETPLPGAVETPKGTISEKIRNETVAWGEVGTNMGKALVAAAKEVGVASNDFIQTPLGKITMIIIIYKVIGNAILHIFIGSVFMIFGYIFALYVLFEAKWGARVKYDYKPCLFGLWNKKIITEITDSQEWVFGRTMIGIATMVVVTIIGLGIVLN